MVTNCLFEIEINDRLVLLLNDKVLMILVLQL